MEPEEVIAELKKIVPEYLGTDGEESDAWTGVRDRASGVQIGEECL